MDENGFDSTATENGGALRELATRLLAPPYRSDVPSSEAGKPEPYVGRLPEEMPVEVPVPEGTTSVGGAVHRPPGGGAFYEIVLDTRLPAESFRQAYRRQLLEAGWDEADDYPPRTGSPHTACRCSSVLRTVSLACDVGSDSTVRGCRRSSASAPNSKKQVGLAPKMTGAARRRGAPGP